MPPSPRSANAGVIDARAPASRSSSAGGSRVADPLERVGDGPPPRPAAPLVSSEPRPARRSLRRRRARTAQPDSFDVSAFRPSSSSGQRTHRGAAAASSPATPGPRPVADEPERLRAARTASDGSGAPPPADRSRFRVARKPSANAAVARTSGSVRIGQRGDQPAASRRRPTRPMASSARRESAGSVSSA